MKATLSLAQLLAVLFVPLASVISGCSSGGTTTGPNPAIAISLSPATATIAQGGSQTVTATLTRSGGYAGAVTFAVQGAPTGVTGGLVGAPTTSGATTTATISIAVGAATAPGPYTLTVTGSGTGVTDASASFTLTVTAAPATSFALALNPTSLSIAQGANANTTVTITRTNFTAAVTLSVTGAPSGVTTAFNPTAPTGNSSVLTVTVGGSVTAGNYTLTVHGSGSGENETATLALTVTAPQGGSGNLRVDVSACSANLRPLWVGAQSGTNPWQALTATNNVYQFSVTDPTAGLAWVVGSAVNTTLLIQYYTQAEIAGATITPCGTAGSAGNTVTGSTANVGANGLAYLNFGGKTTVAVSDGPFQLIGTSPNPSDLWAWRHPIAAGGLPDLGFVSRALTVANNGSVGTVDFAGGNAFTPLSAAATVPNLAGGETLTNGMTYYSGSGPNACTLNTLYGGGNGTATTFTAYGVPAANQVAGDYHSLLLDAEVLQNNHVTRDRQVNETFQDFTARLAQPFTLPDALPAPTIALASGGASYLRLVETMSAIPTEYNQFFGFAYFTAQQAKEIQVSASTAWRNGATSFGVTVPDFSGLAGWNNTWVPGAADAVTTRVNFTGSNGPTCQDGHRQVLGIVYGTYP